jgi:hypothetical protein
MRNAMSPHENRGWRFVRLALVLVGASMLMADFGLREDEIDCEKAVAWLQSCCPGFARAETLRCEYDSGCGVTEPAISISDSQCILGESCDELKASGICERAANLPSPSTGFLAVGGGNSLTPNMVCP